MPVFVPDGEATSPQFTPDDASAAGIPKSAPFSLQRAGESLAKTGRVALGLDEPQGLTDTALQIMTTAPIIGVGGALAAGAKIPAALGRIATAAGLGGGQASAQGKSATQGATIDGLTSAAVEGLMGAAKVGRIPLTKLSLKESGAAAREFDRVTALPEQALEYIRSYIPTGWGKWLKVPSLGNQMLSLDDAVKALPTLERQAYQVARSEILDNLRHVEKVTGPMPAKLFEELTSPARFAPPRSSRWAEGARRGLDAPTLRSGLDALSTVETKGVPLGALGGLGLVGAVPEGLGELIGRIRR